MLTAIQQTSILPSEVLFPFHSSYLMLPFSIHQRRSTVHQKWKESLISALLSYFASSPMVRLSDNGSLKSTTIVGN